jgi:hypothetical protein
VIEKEKVSLTRRERKIGRRAHVVPDGVGEVLDMAITRLVVVVDDSVGGL